MYLYLTKYLAPTLAGPAAVLHIAPERQLQRFLKGRTSLDHISGDLSSPAADLALDITRMPFPDQSFDLVLCNHVLEHVPDDRLALSEIYRVLRNGGQAILQVPLAPDEPNTLEDASVTTEAGRLELFGQKDHVRLYGSDYVRRLEDAGFVVSSQSAGELFDSSLIDSAGLSPEERVFHVTRLSDGSRRQQEGTLVD